MSDSSAKDGVEGAAPLAAPLAEPLSITDIKHVFYINLESRVDRRQNIENQLPSVGLTHFERFNAIKLADKSSNSGRVGCTLSHIKCIELAKERGYSHVLICEDDTIFLDPALFVKQINKFFTKQHQWDVILFAGNNVPPYERIDDTCIAVTRCQTTTCYLVNGHYFDTLLTNYKEGLGRLMREPAKHVEYAIDKYWLKLQQKDNWFLITPLTVVQRADYSDIEGRQTNYMYMMTDLDKPHLFRARGFPPTTPRGFPLQPPI
jgi:hypothetical protein